MKGRACHRCVERAPWTSLAGNTALAVYKITVGVLGRSSALVADGCHSAADVIGSLGILFACRVGRKPADPEHPYGHGQAEFIGAIFVYTILAFFSCAIIIGAIVMLRRPEPPGFVTILGALVSIYCNYLMFRFSQCAGTRCNSPAVMADAFENRADALSSVAAALGIGGALLIHPILDPIAALVVGLFILWNSFHQLREAASGLMDRGLSPDELTQIEGVARRQAGVRGIEFLLTRQTGRQFWVDLGVQVDDDAGVNDADAIARAIRAELSAHPSVHEIDIFVVPSSLGREDARAARRLPVLQGTD